MKTKTVTRAFRIPIELDYLIEKVSRSKGFVSPSEYLRYLVRSELESNSLKEAS